MPHEASREVTRILREIRDVEAARRELLPLVYEQLRGIARRKMSDERPDHTLQATALVNEAFLRLVDDRSITWEKRSAFYTAASEAMRRILLDHARKRLSLKRGGDRPGVPITEVDLATDPEPEHLLALDEAMQRLEEEDARSAEVVRLRFYAGLSVEETARVMNVSERTVMREWSFARARLFQLLGDGEG